MDLCQDTCYVYVEFTARRIAKIREQAEIILPEAIRKPADSAHARAEQIAL
jgi:hypothetical protein